MFSVNSEVQWMAYWWPEETYVYLLAYGGVHGMRTGERIKWGGKELLPSNIAPLSVIFVPSLTCLTETFALKETPFFWGIKRSGNGEFALASGNLWFRPLLKLPVSILEAKEIKSYIPEPFSELWNRSHLLAAENREKLSADNKTWKCFRNQNILYKC